MSPTLLMPLTYELLHDRADSLRRHATQVRTAPGRLESLRMFVRDCLGLPDDCRDMATEVQRQAFDELLALTPGSTFDATPLIERRRCAEQVLEAVTGVVKQCIGLVEAPALAAKFAAEARALREALAEVGSVREDFEENFPIPSEEQRQQARVERAAGGGLELDDAFAEIAGCTKEEWLARVRAHEQARKRA